MTWFRGDDTFPQHPKVLRIPRKDRAAAVGLWTLAGMWSAAQLTDGRLDAELVEELTGSQESADLLVAVGLWEKTPTGYAFHDWSDYNPTADEVRTKQRSTAEAKSRAGRLGGIASGLARSRREADAKQNGSTSEADSGTVANPQVAEAQAKQDRSRHEAGSKQDRTTIEANGKQNEAPSRPVGEGLTKKGGLRNVDAGAREDVDAPTADTDTRPAPLSEDLDGNGRRRERDVPVAPEGAMPVDRCNLHRELAAPPPCRDCRNARKAQEAWKANRDAKVAAARQAVADELAEAKRLERAQVAACGRCDDRGVTPGGVRCTHDDRTDPAQVPEGLLVIRAEMARRRQKATPPPVSPPATGEQLRKLAIAFGEHGTNDRDERLAWCTRNLGRAITSTRDLTKAEASSLIDVLEREEAPRADPPTPVGDLVPGEAPPADEPPDDWEPVDAEIVDDVREIPPDGIPDDVTEWPLADDDEPDDYRLDDEPAYAYAGGPDDDQH